MVINYFGVIISHLASLATVFYQKRQTAKTPDELSDFIKGQSARAMSQLRYKYPASFEYTINMLSFDDEVTLVFSIGNSTGHAW